MKSISKRLADILDRNTLLRLAGSRSYDRGEDYHITKRVRSIVEDNGVVTAKVRGTSDYDVELWLEDGDLGYSCDCPVGEEGKFCKHCVAAGLKLLETGGADRKKTKTTTMDDVRAWLDRHDKDFLVGMLLRHAKNDPDLRKQLLMDTARENPAGLDLSAFLSAIDNAVFVGNGFVDYRNAYNYADGIRQVIFSVEKLLDDGHAAQVVELVEYALKRLANVYGTVDDSGGNVGEVMCSIQELHHEACLRAKPVPVKLAEKLLQWELSTGGDPFYKAAETYADVLGDKGLKAYRARLLAEWEKIPQLGPGGDSSDRYGRRYVISRIMEDLACESGNIDDRVAIMSRDLSHEDNYLQIAQVYKEAGRDDAALEWAERGIKAFSKRTDSRLREFVADEYHKIGRHDDAMTLIWAQFSEYPCLINYQRLKMHADKAGNWSHWREKALSIVPRRRDGKAERRYGLGVSLNNSTLVEIFLWENDAESAWTEAMRGGCSEKLWMDLARRREDQHPDDSLGVYQAAVESQVQRKDNQSYAEAVSLLAKIHQIMARLDRSIEFGRYLTSVRAAHKPKRNFVKMLDETLWMDRPDG